MATDKAATPAYGSYKSFNTFFNARREDGHITTVVDRSLMSNFSGSTANELLASLKFLKMIREKGEPTALYEEYVKADDEARKVLLAKILRDAYGFLYNGPGFDLERGTSAQMAEVFRGQGVSGSTLARAIAFFLSAAKDAGIKVSPNIKVPPLAKNGTSKPKKEVAATTGVTTPSAEQLGEDSMPPAGHQHFDIPIPINRKVRITIPAEWSATDWDLFQSMLTVYVQGWKTLANKPAKPSDHKDKGPTPMTE